MFLHYLVKFKILIAHVILMIPMSC